MIERAGATKWAVACGLLGALGCDAFAAPIVDGDARVIPTDNRAVVQALSSLPPISGGTLALTSDGSRAVVADPDRNSITVVNLHTRAVEGHVALEDGDEPGRVAIDRNGIAHVALRRSGDLLTFDTATATVVRRAHVCGAPRGVAYDASTDRVHVACAGGELVALNASNGAESSRAQLDVDLRDVVVHRDHLVVSRFKSAEQLKVSKEGQVMSKSQTVVLEHSDSIATRRFDPTIAWRTVSDGDQGVVMLHQRAQHDPVVLDRKPEPTSSGSAYGGGSDNQFFGPSCDGIVHSAVSVVDENGQTWTSAPIPGVVLAVDAAVSSDWIALAVAGPRDSGAPRPFTVSADDETDSFFGSSAEAAFGPSGLPQGGVVLVSKSSLSVAPSDGTNASTFGCASTTVISKVLDSAGVPLTTNEQVTAVAFTPTGDLVYLTREPATLTIVGSAEVTFGGGSNAVRIELGGDSVADTGHDIFHHDSGGGIACASCHAEGGDDGHVWEFNTIGRRRTQAVNIGLEGTAPFHWDGDMSGLHEIMDTVFVDRMGGVRQSGDRLGALSGWVFEQSPPAAIRDTADVSAVRGHALFMAPEVGCASCHAGTKLTNNRTVEVGTGELGQRFQVPSLVGIGYRAPFMHTGCASTLRERFTNTECAGGDAHGATSQLNDGQIDDLVAYLETL